MYVLSKSLPSQAVPNVVPAIGAAFNDAIERALKDIEARVAGTLKESLTEALAAPLEETLYFAGEATDTEQSGTVGGALASGQRAAREIAGA